MLICSMHTSQIERMIQRFHMEYADQQRVTSINFKNNISIYSYNIIRDDFKHVFFTWFKILFYHHTLQMRVMV